MREGNVARGPGAGHRAVRSCPARQATAGQQAGVRMVIQAGRASLTKAGPASTDATVVGEVPHEKDHS